MSKGKKLEEVTVNFSIERKTELPTKIIAKVGDFEIIVDEHLKLS